MAGKRAPGAWIPWLFVAFCAASVLIALVPLAFILFFVISQGVQSLNLEFFTGTPKPVGEHRWLLCRS